MPINTFNRVSGRRWRALLGQEALILLILVGALFVSLQFRLQLPYGKSFSGGVVTQISAQLDFLRNPGIVGIGAYQGLRWGYLAVIGGVWACVIVGWLYIKPHPSNSPLRQQRGKDHTVDFPSLFTERGSGGEVYGRLLLAIGLCAAIFWIRWPDLSRMQIAYFGGVAAILGVLMIPIPAYLSRRRAVDVRAALREVWDNRALFLLWTRFNLRTRYSQAVLGIAWVVVLPLSTSLILSVVFSSLLKGSVGNIPLVVFMLSAIVPWNFTNYCVLTSSRSILGALGVINQVYFPREILILVTVAEGLVDAGVGLIALILISTLNGYPPDLGYGYILPILIVQVVLTLSLMFFMSAASVLIRDIPPLLAVGMQLLFFLTPILYPSSTLPPDYRLVLALNPFAPIIQAYRDVILHHVPDWITLSYPAALGVALLFLGYQFFKTIEPQFSDFL